MLVRIEQILRPVEQIGKHLRDFEAVRRRLWSFEPSLDRPGLHPLKFVMLQAS